MKKDKSQSIYIKSIVVLTVICLIVSVLLGAVNYITAPIIERNKSANANKNLLVVMPDGKEFTPLTLTDYVFPSSVKSAFKESSGGFVFTMEVIGYSAGLEIMCGISSEGKITGAVCLSSAETLGAEKTYGTSFTDKSSEDIDGISTVAGATKTTAAYKNAVKDALNAFIVANGGSVDVRTEEEKLNDALKAALPDSNGEFETVFVTDVLENVNAVYASKDGVGYVFSFDKSTEETEYTLIGVKTDGNVATQTDSELSIYALNAFSKVSAEITSTDIDLTLYPDVHANVTSAQLLSNGNYIVTAKGAGFGINGDAEYGISNEYIYIKLSVTPEGTIIDCITEKQSETEGIGSGCGEPYYYSQYKGKTSETYKEVDAIAGATYTTNGYRNAVVRALNAVKLIANAENGGN